MELDTQKPEKKKIIDSLWTFLIATAFLGPFALPLLWRNPRYKVTTKIGGSVVVILLTIFLLYYAGIFLNDLLQLTGQLQQVQ